MKKSKYHKDKFIAKNPNKLVNTSPPMYRSAWELAFMNFCDSHPNIVQWGSECVSIPYEHPLTGKWTMYIPDFLVLYVDKHGHQRTELIEIKPLKEAANEKAKSKYDKLSLAVNIAKWKAAQEWCAKHKIFFRVMTERDLFAN